MDKINGLPDDVLVKILSFLPTKEAVSTCVLSNRWEFLWMWLTKLEFINSMSDPRPGLGDFLDKKLPLHRAPVIESLCYHVTCNSHIKPKNVKQWIEIAISRCVRELEIDYYPNGEKFFIFPSSLFTCKSLVTLKLQKITHMDVPSMVCLVSLKTLQLETTASYFFVDGESLQRLLSGCPVLEDLSLCFEADEEQMKEFTIIIPSLQSFSLFVRTDGNFDGYEIDTPSSKYLKLVDWTYEPHHYSLIKNMPKLREAYVDLLSSYPKNQILGSIISVKRLTICCLESNIVSHQVLNT
ncbi:PREDICTED: FBD-associated F-box protein At5g38590-like [Camelina sativa]|uniref:FBD-associated F-box protein At5g38590-like n=1 Tax=Camelina sativa TaxID=90675 RepID=A0ABM0USM1_CAMSA|nr:PREDICTED: FBD-associated F-box protein At5g38590-like [Camelina sativa]